MLDLFSYAGIDINNSIDIKPNKERLGIVYQGSKRQIAEPLLRKMHELRPNAIKFYDLFGGGGAMSAYAVLCGYNVVYNELNSDVFNLFKYFASGKEVTQVMLDWCNRAEFAEIKKKNKTRQSRKLLNYLFIATALI